MLRVGLIGCGNWSKTIIKEIKNNHNFLLKSVVCRNGINDNFGNNIDIFKSIEALFQSDTVDCVYVAAIPQINLNVVRNASLRKLPLILEKPICSSFLEAKDIENIVNTNNLIILPNISNYFSEIFKKIKEIINVNYEHINKIYFYEGDNGPVREKIHPIWDWGFHSLSMLSQIFDFDKMTNLNLKEIKKDINNKKIVSKFSFKFDEHFNIDLVTGNFFKKKIRKIKIICDNQEIFIGDLMNHELFNNNKLIFKNKLTPISSLLNDFYYSIKNHDHNLSKNLLKGSCQATRVLEEFYKC